MSEIFEMLKSGLDDAIDYHKKKKRLRTTKLIIPKQPKQYKSQYIKKLRARLEISQSELASILFISPKTVQAWEAGIRNPTSSALRLLQILDNDVTLFSFNREKLLKVILSF